MSDSVRAKIKVLRKKAHAYGDDGQYGKQLRAHMRARELAVKASLDSLRRVASASIGNIYAACRQNPRFCKGIQGRSFLSRWRAEKPIVLLLCSLILFTLYMILEEKEAR